MFGDLGNWLKKRLGEAGNVVGGAVDRVVPGDQSFLYKNTPQQNVQNAARAAAPVVNSANDFVQNFARSAGSSGFNTLKGLSDLATRVVAPSLTNQNQQIWNRAQSFGSRNYQAPTTQSGRIGSLLGTGFAEIPKFVPAVRLGNAAEGLVGGAKIIQGARPAFQKAAQIGAGNLTGSAAYNLAGGKANPAEIVKGAAIGTGAQGALTVGAKVVASPFVRNEMGAVGKNIKGEKGNSGFTISPPPTLDGPQFKWGQTVAKNPEIPDDLKPQFTSARDVRGNKETLDQARKSIGGDNDATLQRLINKQGQFNTDDNAQGVVVISNLLKEGRMEEAMKLTKAMNPKETELGQAIQILSAYNKLTPAGALREAQGIINRFNKGKGAKKQIALTQQQAEDIVARAEEVQSLPEGSRERQIAAAGLLKATSTLTPASTGSKVAMAQTLAQLLNPKTAIRNIVGSGVLSGAEDVARVVATPIDKAASLLTRQRSVTLPQMGVKVSGGKEGYGVGVEDVQLGIRTQGSMGQLDINREVFAPGSIGNKLEKALGYELGVPDKVFFTGQYRESLANQMKAAGISQPSKEMVDQAEAEALYATFQNNSKIAEGLQGLKRGLNVKKDFGLGDLVLKYPKTPGNILSVGMDYSPVGFAKGLYQFFTKLDGMTPTQQREAVLNIGRGVTGSGLIAGGAMLADKKIITANPDADKDVRAAQKDSGQSPFSINISALKRLFTTGQTDPQEGDTIMNYDWLQPNAIQLSMGANMILNAGKKVEDQLNSVVDSFAVGVDTLTQQGVVRGVADFARTVADAERGGGLVKAVSNAASGLPSSFVPSIVNQVGQLTDNVARSTYDPNFFNEMLNKAATRIPGGRATLNPQIDPGSGQPIEQYQNGSNNPFNVFLNPAFVREYQTTPQSKLPMGIYNRTGERDQFPRVADKSQKINGEQVKLSPDQLEAFQRYTGSKTQEAFSKLAADPEFTALSDEEKAGKMQDILTRISGAARVSVLANQPKTEDPGVTAILEGNNPADKVKSKKKEKGVKVAKKTSAKGTKVSKGRKGRAITLKGPGIPKPRNLAAKGVKIASSRAPSANLKSKGVKISTKKAPIKIVSRKVS